MVADDRRARGAVIPHYRLRLDDPVIANDRSRHWLAMIADHGTGDWSAVVANHHRLAHAVNAHDRLRIDHPMIANYRGTACRTNNDAARR